MFAAKHTSARIAVVVVHHADTVAEGDRLHKDGVGLGLAITKRNVDSHERYIETVANAGKGSVFRVVIPHMRKPKVKET